MEQAGGGYVARKFPSTGALGFLKKLPSRHNYFRVSCNDLEALDEPCWVPDHVIMLDASILEPLHSRQAQISKRRSDLSSRMEKLRREDEALTAEQEELATTLKTLARVYDIDLSDLDEPRSTKASGKPEGTPTLYEMVVEILQVWELVEDQPVEGDQIFEEIRRRYWPNAPRNSIIPSLWRFAKEGRLHKEGTTYCLPQNDETPGAVTPDASVSEGEIDDDIPF